jgi:hypothetical protein
MQQDILDIQNLQAKQIYAIKFEGLEYRTSKTVGEIVGAIVGAASIAPTPTPKTPTLLDFASSVTFEHIPHNVPDVPENGDKYTWQASWAIQDPPATITSFSFTQGEYLPTPDPNDPSLDLGNDRFKASAITVTAGSIDLSITNLENWNQGTAKYRCTAVVNGTTMTAVLTIEYILLGS